MIVGMDKIGEFLYSKRLKNARKRLKTKPSQGVGARLLRRGNLVALTRPGNDPAT